MIKREHRQLVLGSYINEMVTELGGEVRLEGRENKRGCKFIVCLPEGSLKREGE